MAKTVRGIDLDFSEILEQMSENLMESRSLFMFLHTEKGGEQKPLIALDADHLINILNLNLVKRVNEYREALIGAVKRQFTEGYAPIGMDAKQARTLQLKVLDDGMREELEQRIRKTEEEIEERIAKFYNAKLILMMPYIVVGTAREDTCEGVRRILQSTSGITERIDVRSSSSARLLSTAYHVSEVAHSINWRGDFNQDNLPDEDLRPF